MLDKLRCSQDDPSLIDHFATLFRQWRLATGVSLALSLAVLGIVIIAAVQGADRAMASPLAEEPSMSIVWSGGSCAPCSQADPNGYDPLMGFFNLNRTGQRGDYNYDWHRTGVPNEPHTLGTVTVTSFLFWLHRNKGCGDFEMTATPSIPGAPVLTSLLSLERSGAQTSVRRPAPQFSTAPATEGSVSR